MLSVPRFLAPILYLTVFSKIRPSTSFGLGLRQHHASTAFADLRTHRRECHHRIQTRLFVRNSNDNNDGTSNRKNAKDKEMATRPLSNDVKALMDPGLWITDFVALILASQLIGLLNVINSPEFIANGGWFQPIPAVPSTLDELVQRISSFGIAWAIASASVIFLAKTTSNDVVLQKRSDESDTAIILKRNIQTLAAFGILLLIGNGIVFGLGGAANGMDGNSAIPWLDVLRNCYYVGLSTSGLRFLYGQYFLLS